VPGRRCIGTHLAGRARTRQIEGVEDPRTLQANERTLLAWLRTGISLVTFGFVIEKTALWLRLNETGALAISRSHKIGTTFIFLGVAAEAIGLIRYLRVKRALLERRSAPTGAREVIALVIVVGLLGLLLGVYGMVRP
jgi:putative membrane protein